jgi:parallel beta-helix repeat protein
MRLSFIATATCVLLGSSSGARAALPYSIPSNATPLYPSDNLQSKVSNAPEGTTFVLKSGLFRQAQIAPRNRQVFLAEAGVTMNGSKLVTPFREGNYYVAYGQSEQNQVLWGSCESGYPRCSYPEELFLDDRRLLHVDSVGAVGPGKWYLDYNADKLYMYDNPSGHKVEVSTTRYAFYSSATGVVIRGVTIEKYASPAQMGAIGNQFPANNWTVEYCDIRLNHGAGIMFTTDWKIRFSKIHDNGQLGLRGIGDRGLVESNELYGNNDAHFAVDWEGGATKFLGTNGLTIRGNTSHHNIGLGLWSDLDNINTIYENNTLYNNRNGGISHEMSYDAVIRNNNAWDNGLPQCPWIWDGQIQVQNSPNVQVYGNTVTTSTAACPNGINVIDQSRGSGRYGPHQSSNVQVHNNVITMKNNAGFNGGGSNYSGTPLWNTTKFDYNTYHMPETNANRFEWGGSWRNWDSFKSWGQEIHGTADTAIGSATPGGSACPDAASNAFTACYYTDMNLTTLGLTRVDTAVNFWWARNAPAEGIPADYFSVKWNGKFSFNAANYTFRVTADDGFRLYVDGSLVLDKWFVQGATTYTVVKSMTAGTHTITMTYFEQRGDAVAQLSW